MVKNSPASAGDIRESGSIPWLGRSREEGMAMHSSILAWRIPWTGEPDGLQSIGSQRVELKWFRMHAHSFPLHQGLATYGPQDMFLYSPWVKNALYIYMKLGEKLRFWCRTLQSLKYLYSDSSQEMFSEPSYIWIYYRLLFCYILDRYLSGLLFFDSWEILLWTFLHAFCSSCICFSKKHI